MKKSETANRRPTNFRLLPATLELLADVAHQTGMTKTEVVELCVLRQALLIPEVAEAAKAALAEASTQNLGGRRAK